MKQALFLFAIIASAFVVADITLGYEAAYSIGYGAISVMAVMISLTFLWLWRERATPLALGMSFSWAGAASVMGWWWIYNVLSAPNAMFQSWVLFVFLSLYFVGAILHFATMQRSMGLGTGAFVLPIGAAILLSGLIHFAR
jgi:hypothetical protein